MKKRITMIFVTLLAVGLCACGSSGQKKAAPEDAGIETKEAGKGSEETAETNGLVVSWPEKMCRSAYPIKRAEVWIKQPGLYVPSWRNRQVKRLLLPISRKGMGSLQSMN